MMESKNSKSGKPACRWSSVNTTARRNSRSFKAERRDAATPCQDQTNIYGKDAQTSSHQLMKRLLQWISLQASRAKC